MPPPATPSVTRHVWCVWHSLLSLCLLLLPPPVWPQTIVIEPLPPVNLVARARGYAPTAPTPHGDVSGPGPSGRIVADLKHEEVQNDARLLLVQINALISLLPADHRLRWEAMPWKVGFSTSEYERQFLRTLSKFVDETSVSFSDLEQLDGASATEATTLERKFLGEHTIWQFAEPADLRKAMRRVLAHRLLIIAVEEKKKPITSLSGPYAHVAALELPPLQSFKDEIDVCEAYLPVVELQVTHGLLEPHQLANMELAGGKQQVIEGVRRECEEANKIVHRSRRLARALDAAFRSGDPNFVEVEGGGFRVSFQSKPKMQRDAEQVELNAAWNAFHPSLKASFGKAVESAEHEARTSSSGEEWVLALVNTLRPRAGYFGRHIHVREAKPLMRLSGGGVGPAGSGDGFTFTSRLALTMDTNALVPRPSVDPPDMFDQDDMVAEVKRAATRIDAAYWNEIDFRLLDVADSQGAVELERAHAILYRQHKAAMNDIHREIERQISVLATRRDEMLERAAPRFTPEPGLIVQSWLVQGQSFEVGDTIAAVVPLMTSPATISYRLGSPSDMLPGSQWALRLIADGELAVAQSTRRKLLERGTDRIGAVLRRLNEYVLRDRPLRMRITSARRSGLGAGTFRALIHDDGPLLVNIDELVRREPDVKTNLALLRSTGLVLHRFGQHLLYLERGVLNGDNTYKVTRIQPYAARD